MVYRMLDEEGIYIGASSALNVVAAVEMARHLGSGSKVATIICDGAYRYSSRLFSKKWLHQKGLFEALPYKLQKYAVLD
jgi:cysteine synthase A